MTALAFPSPDTDSIAELVTAEERAAHYAEKSLSEQTRNAYARDFASFEAWCASIDVSALPAAPETVVHYITALADRGYAVATIGRHLTSISVSHRDAGFTPSPTTDARVHTVLRGIRRDLGVAQRKKTPLLTNDLRKVLASFGDSPADVRDRALLVIGFAGALRRSEIVALDVADIDFVRAGLAITIRKSKTDQEGRGELIGLPYAGDSALCPVRSLAAWLAISGITAGAIFRGVDQVGRISPKRLCARAVALIVKKRAKAAGITADIGGHSLRAGCCTEASNRGVPLAASMQHSRHKSIAVAMGYIRQATIWENNVAAKLGL